MKVLIACEYSGRVRDAFIRGGHDAMSCDILPSDSPGPHYQGDVLDILDDGWDLMIAHRASPSPDRWKLRSTTFPGIAAAMADQWGVL